MLRRHYFGFFLSLSFLLIVGCSGGTERRGFLELPDLTIADLQVVGGQLQLDDEDVIEFDPGNTGPYFVEMGEGIEELEFTLTFPERENVEVQFLEVEADNVTDPRNNPIETTTLESDVPITVDIDEGINVYQFIVIDVETDSRVIYVVEARRVSTTAFLQDVRYVVNAVELPEAVGTCIGFSDEPPEDRNCISYTDGSTGFDPDDLDYEIEVSYQVCDLGLQPVASTRLDGVSINDQETLSLFINRETLRVGENTFILDVTSEDGVSTRSYDIAITRRAPTAEQIAADVTLVDISMSTGEQITPFSCNTPTYSQRIDNRDDSVAVVVEATNENASLTIGRPLIDEITGEFVLTADGFVQLGEAPEFIDSNQEFLLEDLEVGVNEFVITVTAATQDDFLEINQYIVLVARSQNNRVRVNSAEQLHAALANAQPGDEIFVEQGTYIGTASVDISGSDSAYFYSAQDGTEEASITLIGDGEVVLAGTDIANAAAFELAGDNWIISNIQFTTAQNGLVLNGASNNRVSFFQIRDVGGSGLELVNGSSDNELLIGNIDNTGLSVTAEDPGEVDAESIVVGDGTTESINNVFQQIVFNENAGTELVGIRPLANQTELSYNVFNIKDGTVLSDMRSTILVEADQTQISFNEWMMNASADASSVSSLVEVGADNGTTEVFQNLIDIRDNDIPFVSNSSTASVDVADNSRLDSGEIVFIGDNINEDFTTPIYQIQSTVDETKCLSLETVTVDVDIREDVVRLEDLPFVLLSDCESVSNQFWRFINDGDGFATISVADDDRIRLAASRDFNVSFALIARANDGSNLDEGFFLRWRPSVNDGGVTIISKDNPGNVITEIEPTSVLMTDKNVAAVIASAGTDEQRFLLIRQ